MAGWVLPHSSSTSTTHHCYRNKIAHHGRGFWSMRLFVPTFLPRARLAPKLANVKSSIHGPSAPFAPLPLSRHISTMVYKGACYCKAVKYEIDIASPDEARTSLCHCKNCKVDSPMVLSLALRFCWDIVHVLSQRTIIKFRCYAMNTTDSTSGRDSLGLVSWPNVRRQSTPTS